MNYWHTLREQLSRPEYVHVLVNPLPVYGLAIAAIALAIALISRERATLVTALVLVLLSSLSAWPTYLYGEAGYDRVKARSDSDGEQWLDEHMARGEKYVTAFYVLAGLALIAIVAPRKWPRSSAPLAIITFTGAVVTLGIGAWISYAGGRVQHKEFRFERPPPAREQNIGNEN